MPHVQLPLFGNSRKRTVRERPIPYVRGSETSRAAADSIKLHVVGDRERVLAYLQLMGSRGATDQELQEALDIAESTERPRRVSLVDDGLVIDSGATRDTRAERKATV